MPVARILVPLAAVLRDADTEPFCFLASGGEGGHVAERRAVRVGGLHGDRIAISSGLETGDRLITRGQHFLRPGDAVRVVRE